MGQGTWSADSYRTYASNTGYRSAKSTADVFTSTRKGRTYVDPSLDVRQVVVRESCDSDFNPNSTPIIFGLDVTGSMGVYADKIARDALPELMTAILNEKPISDPHLMFMGIDDAKTSAGLAGNSIQMSQFEADIRIVEQLRLINLVGGGGGNDSESYDLAWYVAGTRTTHDRFKKRNLKGYLFTMGDEGAPKNVFSGRELTSCIGGEHPDDVTTQDMLAKAQETFHVFHIVIEEGGWWRTHTGVNRGYYSQSSNAASEDWEELLGSNVLYLSDFRCLNELVIRVLRANEVMLNPAYTHAEAFEAVKDILLEKKQINANGSFIEFDGEHAFSAWIKRNS